MPSGGVSYWASRFHVFYSHSPLRAIVTTEPTAGVVWKKYFTFYGYEGIKYVQSRRVAPARLIRSLFSRLEVRQHPARENSYCVALPVWVLCCGVA